MKENMKSEINKLKDRLEESNQKNAKEKRAAGALKITPKYSSSYGNNKQNCTIKFSMKNISVLLI